MYDITLVRYGSSSGHSSNIRSRVIWKTFTSFFLSFNHDDFIVICTIVDHYAKKLVLTNTDNI